MKILIIDDHQLFIEGMQLILKRLDEDALILGVNTAEEAISIIESGKDFDLILVDLSMPGMDGLSILQRAHARKACVPLVVVSSELDVRIIKSALDLGALGFIPKSHSSKQMIAAVEAVLGGDIYIPKAIAQQILQLDGRRKFNDVNDQDKLKYGDFTKRQLEVLQLLCKGYSNKQIASTLYLSECTIKAHVSALFVVLHVRNRTECVQRAINLGLSNSNVPFQQ